jgi:hypothetical protein
VLAPVAIAFSVPTILIYQKFLNINYVIDTKKIFNRTCNVKATPISMEVMHIPDTEVNKRGRLPHLSTRMTPIMAFGIMKRPSSVDPMVTEKPAFRKMVLAYESTAELPENCCINISPIPTTRVYLYFLWNKSQKLDFESFSTILVITSMSEASREISAFPPLRRRSEFSSSLSEPTFAFKN